MISFGTSNIVSNFKLLYMYLSTLFGQSWVKKSKYCMSISLSTIDSISKDLFYLEKIIKDHLCGIYLQ